MRPLGDLNPKSIELEDLYWEDYPDVPSGIITYAEWNDGTPLTEDEIQELHDDATFMYDLLTDHLY